jgi:hypothetical protein
MSLDTEMSDSDSLILNLDSAITASIRLGPERAVYNYREYIRVIGAALTETREHPLYNLADYTAGV